MGGLVKHPWSRWMYPPNWTWRSWRQMVMFWSPTSRTKRRMTFWPQNPLVARKHQNLTLVRKPQPNPLQHCNMAMKLWTILGIRIGHANCLGNGGRTTFRHPKTKSLQTIVGEPRYLRGGNWMEWCKWVGVGYERGIQISYSKWHVRINSIAEGPQGCEVQMGILHEEECQL